MATQTIDPREVLELYGKIIPGPTLPRIYDQAGTIPSAASPHPAADVNPELTVTERAAQLYGALMETDSDQRLDYILSAASAVTEHEVNQLAEVTYQWLDGKARDHIRVIAQQHAQTRNGPADILLQCFNKEDMQGFYNLLTEIKFPDTVIAACYALCEANSVAQAAYLIHRVRMSPPLDVSNIEQTPDEVADDLRFVNAK